MPGRPSRYEVSRIFVVTLLAAAVFSAALYLNLSKGVQAPQPLVQLSGVVLNLIQSPGCPCCHRYAGYLRSLGTDVVVREADVDSIFDELKIPPELRSCHLASVGDYVVIGHVPAEALERLLRERPRISGISLPGMPPGSPGMEGAKEAPFEVVAFAEDGSRSVFMVI